MSRATGAGGTGADDESFNPSISADGRVRRVPVAGEQPQRGGQQRVRQRVRAQPRLERPDAGQPRQRRGGHRGDDELLRPGDLRRRESRRSFRSGADNLSTEDDNGYTNVFVRDLSANTTTLREPGNGAGRGRRRTPARSTTDDLGETAAGWRSGPGPTTSARRTTTRTTNMFVRDLVAGRRSPSRAARPGAGGPAADDYSYGSAISENGPHVGLRRRDANDPQRRRQQHLQQRLRARHRRRSRAVAAVAAAAAGTTRPSRASRGSG